MAGALRKARLSTAGLSSSWSLIFPNAACLLLHGLHLLTASWLACSWQLQQGQCWGICQPAKSGTQQQRCQMRTLRPSSANKLSTPMRPGRHLALRQSDHK